MRRRTTHEVLWSSKCRRRNACREMSVVASSCDSHQIEIECIFWDYHESWSHKRRINVSSLEKKKNRLLFDHRNIRDPKRKEKQIAKLWVLTIQSCSRIGLIFCSFTRDFFRAFVFFRDFFCGNMWMCRTDANLCVILNVQFRPYLFQRMPTRRAVHDFWRSDHDDFLINIVFFRALHSHSERNHFAEEEKKIRSKEYLFVYL